MFETRSIYEPLVKLCKELINEKKALIEENEGLKETLRCIRQDNQELREKLFSKTKDEKLDALEKRVAYLEDRLSPVELGVKKVEEKLEVGKWYDARTFDEATLKKLLPVGTFVSVLTDWHEDEKRELPKVDECFKVNAIVTSVEGETTGWEREETAVYVDKYKIVPNYWFKILKEY